MGKKTIFLLVTLTFLTNVEFVFASGEYPCDAIGGKNPLPHPRSVHLEKSYPIYYPASIALSTNTANSDGIISIQLITEKFTFEDITTLENINKSASFFKRFQNLGLVDSSGIPAKLSMDADEYAVIDEERCVYTGKIGQNCQLNLIAAGLFTDNPSLTSNIPKPTNIDDCIVQFKKL